MGNLNVVESYTFWVWNKLPLLYTILRRHECQFVVVDGMMDLFSSLDCLMYSPKM